MLMLCLNWSAKKQVITYVTENLIAKSGLKNANAHGNKNEILMSVIILALLKFVKKYVIKAIGKLQ